ncbi:non-hydrolyzing UDP-N-acetylglucosamine 2-epimerase [Effusibacillus pohliae]|uniref:non-hydrolyzing UDP-N-acetylglucosamine 2-epimerase n=1 Tax=Effusibacillus pohliae TaxID=232270 RepID=UPI00036A2CBC|nr:UDP-N-acetylglucosamine 2-epimerase (non-hydrolyzing) [Effusibacillus pohliae]
MKLAVIVGTRPELIKMALVIQNIKQRHPRSLFIHSGQHYDDALDKRIAETFGLPEPDCRLHVGSGSHATTTANIMVGVEQLIDREKIETVIVHGDTNTTLGAALAAAKRNCRIAHVEAGLRSFDRQMPEEINRKLVDHMATHLFAPTRTAARNLQREGIRNGIYLVGQTIVDALAYINARSGDRPILGQLGLAPKQYLFVTIHRQENTDDPARLRSIVQALRQISGDTPYKVVLSLHPRTKRKLAESDLLRALPSKNLIVLDPPAPFADSVLLQREARIVLTDSGGLQEEACILGTPCITLRLNTERPETVACGANRLAGTDTREILQSMSAVLQSAQTWIHPYGPPGASEKIVRILLQG